MSGQSPRPHPPVSHLSDRELVRQLETLRRRILVRAAGVDLSEFGANRESARNLLHYLALRRVDLRQIQRRLSDLGLSSLGRAEGHTFHHLDAVLGYLRGPSLGKGPDEGPVRALSPQQGRHLLHERAERLLGIAPVGRTTRIMVTLPSEAADDYGLVRDLVAAGTDVARINCAHDVEADWGRMIGYVRRAVQETGRPCRIEMDLAGPKLRSGPLTPGPTVLRIRPRRDDYGRVLVPGRLWLAPTGSRGAVPPSGFVVVPVPSDWLRELRVPSIVRLTDARGAPRRLQLVRRRGEACEAETMKTIYLTAATELSGRARNGKTIAAAVEELPAREPSIRLTIGDRLRVASDGAGSSSRASDPPEAKTYAGVISCSLPQALSAVRVGHRIWFDDGKIGSVVEHVDPHGVDVRITHAAPNGTRLRPNRGINLPDSEFPFPSLTDEDRSHLPFVVEHADLVGYSFVRTAADVRVLRAELARLGRPRLGIVLKIEAREAFDELPAILFEALRGAPAAIMIARGDLAVEVGYDRLAEVQEEILWLCEAAHLPVIWATEVLAGLTKVGVPTRAEVTDAAMGERAECVMLNKGPHIVVAVRALDSILRRMESHQEKKSARLRHLAVAERFFRSRRTGGQAPPPTRASRRSVRSPGS